MSRDEKIVEFPKPEEVTPEERARRLRIEVERLARLPTVEWMYYVESVGYAEKYGTDKDHARADGRGRHQGEREEGA